jgi:hypothetical protein
MRWVLNSAVIPAGCFGRYSYRTLTREEAAAWLRVGSFVSRVGYPATRDFLQRLARGVQIPLSREVSPLAPGDVALVARLGSRIPEAQMKGGWMPTDDDFELGLLERID